VVHPTRSDFRPQDTAISCPLPKPIRRAVSLSPTVVPPPTDAAAPPKPFLSPRQPEKSLSMTSTTTKENKSKRGILTEDEAKGRDTSRFSRFPSFGRRIKERTASLVERFRKEKSPDRTWHSDHQRRGLEENALRTLRTTITEMQNSEDASSASRDENLMQYGDPDERVEETIPTHHRRRQQQKISDPDPVRVALPTTTTAIQESGFVPVLESVPEPARSSSRRRFICDPPVSEVSQHYYDIPYDFSDLSSECSSVDISRSLRPYELEFSLKKGFVGQKSHLLQLSKAIVQSMDRQNRRCSGPRKCRALVLDPEKKLFELVTVSNIHEMTTLGDFLDKLPGSTSDRRLSRLRFSGLCLDGIFFDDLDERIEVILSSSTTTKKKSTTTTTAPFLAVPMNYQPSSIIPLGNSLLNMPQMMRLLKTAES